MKRIILKTNNDYFEFFNKYKDQINIYMINFTKAGKIRVFYDIM